MKADIVFSLVDRIYAAADQPARWQDFVNVLSEVLGDAAVSLALQLPGSPAPARSFQRHIGPEFTSALAPLAVTWLPVAYPAILNGFEFVSDEFFEEALVRSKLYLEWMKPQGMVLDSPLAHVFAIDDGTPLAAIAVFRRQGCRPFTDADRRICNLLAPHLACAFRLYRRFGGEQHEHLALAEVVNRLQLGVILVDRKRRLIVTNQSADRLIALNDGFTLKEDGLHAQNVRDDTVMQEILGNAIVGGCDGNHVSSFMAVSRPTGKRAFPVVISSLLEAGGGEVAEDAVASLLVNDPEVGHAITPELMRDLYDLTPAESELVGHLADGQSLESAADLRGVTLNTVRSQLKQVFAKTDTNRQAQLIRLVLTGSAEFQEDDES